jgi:hypothetical protein
MWKMACFALLVLAAAPRTCASDRYVNAQTGNDANDGSSPATPFRTLQKAVSVLSPGETCHVAPGIYPERVHVTRSGAFGSPIHLKAEGPGVVVHGFTVENARYVAVEGFEITLPRRASLDADVAGTGVALIDTHGCEIRNCYIHHTLREGVMLRAEAAEDSLDSSYNLVAGNRIEYAGGYAGITVSGAFQTIQGNDISHSVQNPLYPTPSTANGSDADGIKFCGQGLTIRGNYIHDISPVETGNVDPHIDALQTYGPARNILIEDNHINLSTSQGETQAAMIEHSVTTVQNITIRYNVVTAYRGFNIWGLDRDTNPLLPIYGVIIANNTFYGVKDYDFELHDCPDAIARNNAISASGRYMWFNFNPSIGNNAVPGRLTLHAGDIRIGDPRFVNPAARDFHLEDDSPLIDQGSPVGCNADFGGAYVPQGLGPDIGAFEHPGTASLATFQLPFPCIP